jgi:hypothetical protein
VKAFQALVVGFALTAWAGGRGQAAEPWLDRAPDTIRIATFNAGLVRKGASMLVHEMAGDSAQIDAVAEIILRVRPDILLLNKFDRDPTHRALTGFAERLKAGVAGLEGLDYVLPSVGLKITGSGVFWPKKDSPLARLIAAGEFRGRRPATSDHRLVWVDLALGR